MMKTYMTKIFTVLMLIMFSLSASADVKVFFGEKGEELKTGETKIKGDNGTIAIEQKASDDGSQTTIYLTFTPNSGYTISTDNIEVYAVISTGSGSTRTPEISGDPLKLNEESSKDPEKRYSVKIDSNLGLWIKKAEFISGSKGNRGVINITTDTDGNGTIDDSEKHLYLIQTCQFESFYITPKDGNLNTVNLPHTSMLWYFMEAENDNGTQYYYIVNNSTGYYICNSDYSSKGRTIKLLAFDDNSTDKFKFKFVENNPTGTTGYYNIDIKPNGGSYPALNKQGGNALSTNGIRLTEQKYVNNTNSRWKFIPYNGTFVWPDPPFTPSTDLEKHYYKIRNKKDNTYYISTNPSTGKVTYSSIESNDMAWYFKEASSDGFYYVINPAAGNKYMYYDGNTSTSDKTSAVSIKDINEANAVADRFLFVIVQAAAVVGNTDDPDNGYYMIVPKLLIGNLWSSNSLGNKTPSDGSEMGIIAGRVNSDNAYPHWSFETTEYSTACGSPIITYSSTTGKVSITTTTTDAVIHYTIDGVTEPSSSVGTLYGAPFDVTGPITIKAIATKTGSPDSEVTTVTFEQVTMPTIQINGSNAISITCDTEGAAIYYTTDGNDPTTSSTPYTEPLTENVSGVTIKAIAVKDGFINSAIGSNSFTLQCAKPIFTKSGDYLTITCAFPSNALIYFTKNGGEPSASSTPYTGPISVELHDVIKAIAIAPGYDNSLVATKTIHADLTPTDGKYLINSQNDFETFVDMANEEDGASYHYVLKKNVDAGSEITQPFTGIFEADADAKGNFYTISGLDHALFNSINGGTVKNVILDGVNIQSGTNVGAICNEASGASRIYNCGVLGTLTETVDDNDKVTQISSTSTISGSGYVGSIVGLLDGTSRVINCYSFAIVSGGTMAAGIVGNNNQTSTQSDLKTVVVNCMFYGDIKSGSSKYPVYGGNSINNDADEGINPYCYFRKNATFTPTNYNRSWPAEEKNLKRFEYYRSVLNSNRKLCTWWVNGTNETAPTDDDVSAIGIAKWVLDPSIAPYPILKKWDKYSSIINLDPTRVWDPRTEDADGNPVTPHWVDRSEANAWEGKSYGTLSVSINAGAHGSGIISKDITITDMDTLNCDYGYYKIQLPYYNEVFGNPNGATHAAKYAGNYTDYVVTGWEISGGSNAENYNFANRNSYNGRIFAQGGYFYVPEDVESITITAHWGAAVYLANRGYSIDRVNVTAGGYSKADKTEASNFAPAGTIPNTFQGQAVYDDLQTAIGALGSGPTVYDQAIVLIGNHQVKNGNQSVAGSSGNWHPFTIMSADLDFDNEPDYCLQLQFRNNNDRPGIQPVRFDFLPVIELGLAVRHDNLAYAIGIMVPQGHFEITETALMRTTQYEWDANVTRFESESPVILNGGEFEQLAVRYVAGNRTSYFLLGGHLWFHRFAPGSHPIAAAIGNPRLCPVNVIGGDFPEFYLSGLYRPDKTPSDDQGNPKCYINGGHFGKIHGAGYDKINGSVTFEIDHAAIGEFYGGGINGSNPIGGNIEVTIDNSRVDKYCGGPEVGDMTGKTVTTSATGTTFGVFYGGGNGGNSYYRQLQKDGDQSSSHIDSWTDLGYNWNVFNPLAVKDDDVNNENKGYHAEYEFEVFNQSNGVTDQITQRGFIKWIQFGITKTGNVTNVLDGCIIKSNFYGGGNLATVDGTVTSTLTNTTVNGSVFGAGYSAAIPTFQVHDKSTASFPSITAGVITDGHIDYDSRVFEWTNDLNGLSESERKASPTYSKTVGNETKWYCYTWNALENLGKVMGNATLNIDGTTTVAGNVYGGGEESDVAGETQVNISGGTIGSSSSADANHGNVFGGGKGSSENYDCDKAMVGVNNAGAGADLTLDENKVKGTKVIITDGTVNGNVYGGGELGRVEWNTQVTIGEEGNTQKTPTVNGSVFGAGAGVDTHGYSALVRGNSTVTVQGKAKVLQNVYGGGEKATVGRYWVKGINDNVGGAPTAPTDLPTGMPYQQQSGGICTVTIQDNAQIGPDNGGTKTAGHVFGAGKGVLPQFDAETSRKMTKDAGLVAFAADANHETAEDAYLEFLQTLALVTNSNVTIDGSASVKGSVYGGSESGYVQHNTTVIVKGGTIGTTDLGGADFGNVYGGGKGDADHTGTQNNYLAAGIVKGSTKVTIQNTMDGESILYSPTILHNIYGGGAYGTVGVFDYGNDGLPTCLNANAPENSGKTEIHITGGTIGTTGQENGMIFGSSRGDVGAPNSIHDKLAWVYDTHVAIGDTTENATISIATPLIRGSIYGGGENGHNFRNSYVRINGGTIGISTGDNVTVTNSDNSTTTYEAYNYPYRGNVYGGGCGTDKYYASGVAGQGHTLNDGLGDTFNPKAGIVQGNAFVNMTAGYVVHNVYGAGAMGSVGTATSGGKTTVTITGGRIGSDGTRNGNVFGAARGEYGTSTAESGLANVRETHVNISYATTPAGDADYNEDGKNDEDLIAGSVFGGGESGTVKESVAVNMTGGLILKDLYGGGALAHTQTSNWNTTNNTWAEGKTSASSTTTVNLLGGTIHGEAYGGGLGEDGKPAYVYGDVLVDLNNNNNDGDVVDSQRGCVVNQIFGANNVNGTPKGNVTVHVYGTQNKEKATIADKFRLEKESSLDQGEQEAADAYVTRLKAVLADKIAVAEALDLTVSNDIKTLSTNESATADGLITAIPTVTTSINTKTEDKINSVHYDVKAVYGGGNQAAYIPANPWNGTTGAKTQVIIDGCSVTSIETVYGGGNAAAVPETNVTVNAAYEIESVFGGGNGKDDIAPGVPNPGADVGTPDHGTSTYGTGNANTLLVGGYIHEAYGGSNQLGKIKGKININMDPPTTGGCPLDVEKLVGAGKNADVDGDLILILGCKPTTKTPLIFAGADNANVNGNVELTITSGTFGKVFGGNNLGGVIKGHILLNIEETGCNPIRIDELYLGGNEAAYSIYGYYEDTQDNNKVKPRTAAMHAITDPNATGYVAPLENPTADATHTFPYAEPVLNIVSATSIGKVFGGGWGESAVMHADPTVNINMILGTATGSSTTDLGTIGDVYGGGNAANVIGNTTVNIGTETTVQLHELIKADGTYQMSEAKTVLGANITGDVFGGGQLADVGQYDVANDHVDIVGNTYVNIGAKEVTVENNQVWQSVAEGTSKVTIGGNVFGGGEGEAIKPTSNETVPGAFKCAKAIVTGGTNIHIGNGTINGTVYGGGEVGRVEGDAVVAIGIGAGGTTPASAPTILGDVFGAGKGKKTHGYSALLRGNPAVTIEGDAKVRGSVYGGGEIASVGRYNVKKGDNDPEGAPADVLPGMPYSLANSGSGYCTVTIQGNAEIGPEAEMKMTKAGGPDDTGHVIGGGKGVLPYDGYGVTNDDWVGDPWRVSINDQKDIFNKSNATYTTNYEKEYFKYIETLALATETNVTIAGNAFVKGSVYGGSLNGHVQHDTHVNIAGGQIGAGEGVNRRYTETEWTTSTSLAECPHWDYDPSSGAPYDPLATASGTYDYTNFGFVPVADRKANSDEGLPEAKDGHTYYGNVFGGGSGVIPYAPGLWHRGAGSVGGDTYVTITGGHILTSVYGGNEHTDVGTYEKDTSGQPTTKPAETNARGKCTVNMTGGTVGVPRTLEQIQAHPVSCYVFGAGKGDQRIFFNTWTNVIDTEVNISGDARIYGSTFGGGEDGHVIGNAETNIGTVTITTGKDANGDEKEENVNENGLVIGTTGTSYVDGNVFGGGRGFSGEAQTAGTVGGNVRVNINAGSVYGSVYGGGRLASVGTMFEFPTKSNGDPNPAYGQFKEDDTNGTYGHVTINISGGTIGRDFRSLATLPDGVEHSGNVFGGSMGRLELLNGTRNPIWPKMAQVKETNVNIFGTAVVYRSVYGGGELGTVRDNAYVTIGGQKTADADNDGNVAVTASAGDATHPTTVMRDVYGGGYGSEDRNYTIFTVPELISTNADPADPNSYESHTYAFTPMQFAGCVGKNTYVNVAGGYIRKSVYGGGEMASVGVINYRAAELTSGTSTDGKVYFHDAVSDKDYYYENMVKHGDVGTEFALSWPYELKYVDGYPGATHVKVTGGRLGLKTGDTDTGFDDNGDVYGAGKGQAGDYKDFVFCANVGSTDVEITHTNNPTAYSGTDDLIAGAVYGGGEDGHVMRDTKVTLKSGLVYHSIYGGGSGKGKFTKTLDKTTNVTQVVTNNTPNPAVTPPTQTETTYEASCYSITAGKVFGNTEVVMTGGTVIRNVYGGGNMGSVGKGNYAGGSDDYSEAGYGEKVDKLWSGGGKFSEAFLNSGKCTVKISGGTIGYIDTTDPSNSMYPWNSSASLPYGNVFGGCRGESAPNIVESPRYLYSPEFFVGYANETEVTIEGDNTKILGSVYGGGMDGHVRRDAHVIIKGGEIGIPFTDANKTNVKTDDPNDIQWLARGNVYGAGSGIGKYKYDFNYDGDYLDEVDYKMSETRTVRTKEEDFSTSAGSVTRFTKVEIQGGTIHRNVYGGGSLSSIGAPKIGQSYLEYRKDDTADHGVGKQTLNEVVISGGQIGDGNSYADGVHVYGGHVFGGSRGDASLNTSSFSTSMFTSITVNATNNPTIYGSVFGGGEVGIVKGSVDVTMNGGTVNDDVYGGGALANTNTGNPINESGNLTSEPVYNTTVNLMGGLIKGDAYGGGLGQLHKDAVAAQAAQGTPGEEGYVPAVEAQDEVPAIAAMVYGNVDVTLGNATENVDNATATSFMTSYYTGDHAGVVKSGRVFGCNNLNGSPKGNVTVTVNRTVDGQDAEGHTITKSTINRDAQNKVQSVEAPLTYQLPAVYGGGNLADYTATGKKTNVIINSCDVSIKEVYGGGNAAKVPETDVLVMGAHEIESLFGGGNGADKYTLDGGSTWHENPGADIDGNANTLIKGGYVHEAYGGSNEKGTITGSITIDTGSGGCAGCPVKVDKLVGAGKNADVNGDLIMIMGCKDETFIPVVYGGADNANVKGNVELTITSGHFGKVFGGNNAGGSIFGHITLNIEETSECEPIRIEELYLGGNDAAYSRYGYYQDGTDANGKPIYKPRTAAMHAIAEGQEGYVAPVNNPSNDDGKHPFPYDQPVLNVISCTSIDEVFGGGYGVGGAMYADPTVNINMIKGSHFSNISATTDNPNQLGEIGTVYGGGNAADVIGNPTVNIGTATTVTVKSKTYDPETDTYTAGPENVLGAYITGDVFGGGKGSAENYECDKAMVGKNNEGAGEVPGSNDNKDKGTKVNIANGTVKGSVYGGGQLGRVEWNTQVTIGTAGDTNDSPRPVISGSVFGAGAGVETHGYSALVRGNSTVTVQGKAKVLQNVYGGGEKATVGRYWVKGINNMDAEGNVIDAAKPVPGDLPVGMPYKQQSGGICTVIIQDNAQIGPDDGGTSTAGHVFGAGKGVVPQFNAETSKKMTKENELVTFSAENGKTPEDAYIEFLQTLALATNSNVTIDGSATVKGSVYGGSESGYVQHNTDVIVKGGTIGTPDQGGVDFGNVFGGGKGDAEHTGSHNNYIAGGIVKGSTRVEIENGTILHNIYGGGAYGSVGVFDYDTNTGLPIALNAEAPENSGRAEILITGGTIGTNGHENGMVFGSSRGDVGEPGAVHDKLAWVYDALVTIGTQNSQAGPQINGSLYGSGENGHTFHDAVVTIHSGTIGITDKSIDGGARYAYRGNVYGGGCGTDIYTGANNKKYYNPLAGIVYGNATVNMDGGHVVRNIYGGGAMGSVGNFTFDTNTSNDILDGKPISCATGGGTCYINISGGMVGNPGAQMTASGGPDSYGLVFGAGRGDALDPEVYPNVEVTGYVNNTAVTISGTAFVTGTVFGGSQSGHVLGNTSVTIAENCQIGCGEGETGPYTDWSLSSLKPCAHWAYEENGRPYDKFYGTDDYDAKGGHTVATDGHTFYGNVFGGGSGYSPYAAGKWLKTSGVVEGNASVNITGGHILTGVYGGNEHTDVVGSCTVNMSGGTVGVPMTDSEKQAYPITGNLYGAGKGDKRILFNTWTNVGSTSVTVSGGTVYGEVFGGGEDGHVLGNAETTINGATIGMRGESGYDGNVFGGGRGSVTALTAGVVGGNATLNILDGQVMKSAYGGGRLASVGTNFAMANDPNYGKMQSGDHGKLTVNISGGTISQDVFGGCMGTTDGDLHDKLGVAKSTIVNLMGGTVNGSIYGGGEVGDVGELAEGESASNAFAKVNLLGGSVVNVYGGGLGKKTPEVNAKALVMGNATVNLNGLEKADYDAMVLPTAISKSVIFDEGHTEGSYVYYRSKTRASGCQVTGNIFGCNNVNGTPEGHAKVHVFMTTPRTGQTESDYDVSAIYGGGNQADYEPTDEEQSTEVIIEGCDLTKIQQVYGGGNAAASPGTKVTVKGTLLIDEVFGGGNGVSTDDFTNPGANVGYHTKTSPTDDLTPYTYGEGKSVVELIAGTIRNVYGGSNSNGNIRGGSSITQPGPPAGSGPNLSCCNELKVNQVHGGGKNADMNSGVNIVLGCTNSQTWVDEIYPGAESANIGGDVSLTITSGKFGRVFGGNNKSGTLDGSITINIEENGACGVPVIIGEIYGGGNKAPYSVYGYDSNGTMLTSGTRVHADPQINVRAFTSIGTIYGGGYGESAIMYGSPTVNINEVDNNRTTGSQINTAISQTFYEGTANEFTVTTPTHDDGKIGAINNVFGGGNAAKVDGNTTVNVGTTEYEYLLVTDDLVVGTTDVSDYYTRAGAGTTASPFVYTKATGTAAAETTYYKRYTVVGADIRGNVYGGGNKAEVTGNTNVVIGRQASE